MKKLLLSLSAAVALTASATTVTLTPQSLETIVDKQTFSVVTGNANFTIIVDKVNNSTAPTYNANGKDLRVYANGTLSVQAAENLLITDIVFNISSAGLKRLAPITASDGSIAPQTKGDNTVTWSGENNSIVFTVGAKADYGSDGSDKAGQFDITDMVVTYVEAGSTAVLAPSISYDNTTDVVTITTHTEGASIYYTIDGTTPTTESTLYDAPFMLEKSCTVKAIAVKDDVVSAVSTSSITVPARAFTIAEMLSKAPEKGDVVLVSCDLTVVYKYSRYIYVVDNAGGYTLLYGENTYNKGDVIPAGWYVTYSPYSTLPEFAPQSAFPAATSTAEVTYDTIESFSESDINKVAYLKNVTFEAETGAGGTPFSGILADGTEVAFRNNFYVGTVEAGTYNVLMAVAVYNNNLQLYPIEFTEVEEDVEPFEVYVIGSNVNGSSWSEGQADAKFTYLGNGIYEWNGTELASGFKFNDGSWSGNINWGAGEESALVLGEEYGLADFGNDIMIADFDDYILNEPKIVLDSNNKTILVTGTPVKVTHDWYFAGSYNNNVLDEKSMMVKQDNGEYELASVMLNDAEGSFKIASENWSVQYGGEVITSEELSVTLVQVVGMGNDALYEIIPGEYSITWNPETAVVTFKLLNATGVEGIAAEEVEAVYYNLQGVKVAYPTNGIYVKVTGNKSEKISVAE